eukprot:scaffold1850_cov194-Pinguiococcus_pyrenoidosus.AAC.19
MRAEARVAIVDAETRTGNILYVLHPRTMDTRCTRSRQLLRRTIRSSSLSQHRSLYAFPNGVSTPRPSLAQSSCILPSMEPGTCVVTKRRSLTQMTTMTGGQLLHTWHQSQAKSTTSERIFPGLCRP